MVSITRVTIRVWHKNKEKIKEILDCIDQIIKAIPDAGWEIYHTKEVNQK